VKNGVIMNRVLIIFALCLVGAGCEKDNKISSSIASESREKVSESNWKVVVSKDEMRNKELKWLAVRSENNADLKFPYDGENRLQLDILDSKTGTPRVFLTIDKGQYDCGRYGCDVFVKFGENSVQKMDVSIHDVQGTDGTILAFYGNSAAFLENIKKFNSITIEVPFYRNGTRQFKFNTTGFSEAESKL